MKYKIWLLSLALQHTVALALQQGPAGQNPQQQSLHSYWQETAGSLLAQDPLQAEATCGSADGAPSYAGRALTGLVDFSRVQLNHCGFLFSAAPGSPGLLIKPEAPVSPLDPISATAQDFAWTWGWQPMAGSQAAMQLFWQDPGAGHLRAVQLSLLPLSWQTLWTVPFQLTHQSWLAAELSPKRLADDPTTDWLLMPGDAQVPIRMFEARTGVTRQLSLPAVQGSFALLPVAADPDLDGLAERLYLLSREGLLLQYDWGGASGWHSSVVADLRQSGWAFDGSLQRMSARWPAAKGWQQGEVFVLLARDADQYRLLVLRRAATELRSFDLTDVAPAVDPAKAGWQTLLTGRPVTSAKLMAGVLYLPLQSASDLTTPLYDQLLVAQLFSGANVYPQKVLQFAAAKQAPLRLVPDGNNFQLWSAEELLLQQVHTLDPACLYCVEVLQTRHLQGELPLATFRSEQVY